MAASCFRNGTIADVAVDFETLGKLSDAARNMAWAVPSNMAPAPCPNRLRQVRQVGAVEVHLATAYQNAYYDSEHFPTEFARRHYRTSRGAPG